LADFCEVFVHGIGIDGWHDQGRTDAARRTDGTKQISPVEPAIAQRPRPAAALGPNACQRALLTNPGLILKPDLYRALGSALTKGFLNQVMEVFLKAS
jgi:hypothetical protein